MRIKKILKKLVYKYQGKIPFSRALYLKEISRRTKLPFTAINELAKNISVLSAYTLELNPPNDFYGHASILKNFLKFPQDYQFKFIIEHGAVLSDHINEIEADNDLPTIITLSPHRADILKKIKNFTFAIGPYIHYAPHLLSKDEIRREKKRLGKCLLVFPTHSTKNTKNIYDSKFFCREIRRIGKDFDTIRVCLYWKDILDGLHEDYINAGFECVTAGHAFDINFLPRLKSIIETSSYTLSNEIGSYVGYCTFMKKPHLTIPQKIRISGDQKEVKIIKYIQHNSVYNEITEAFSETKAIITKKQNIILQKYWGTNCLKTKKQLLKIIRDAETVYNQ